MHHRVLITGIAGQDGSYLAETLLSRGDEVWGLVLPETRTLSAPLEDLRRRPETAARLHLFEGYLQDQSLFFNLLAEARPDRIYHLAAASSVSDSYRQPVQVAEINGVGTLRLLEAARTLCPEARLFLASTCEMFGRRDEPSDETTPFHPTNPYAASKVMAYWMGVNYREGHGQWIANGIFFNHESPRRGVNFVTRKIARGAAEIAAGRTEPLVLGNLDAKRDWGYAPDYMEAARKVMESDTPDDYVIATGESHSVEEFVAAAFAACGLDWRRHVRQDPELMRPADIPVSSADPTKIEARLGWKARTRFPELVRLMVDAERGAVGGAA